MPSKTVNACKKDSVTLIAQATEPNTCDTWERYPLYYAIKYNAHAIFYHLLKNGADLYAVNYVGGKAEDLMITALKTKNKDTITAVIQKWKDFDFSLYLDYIFVRDITVLNAIIETITLRSIKGLERQFCQKATIVHYKLLISHKVCFSLQQALRYTLTYGKKNVFKYLLSRISSPEQLNCLYTTYGRSNINLLSIAAINGNYDILSLLLSSGANPKVLTYNSRHETMTTLHAICNHRYPNTLIQRGHIIKCINILLKYVDVDILNTNGQTPLMFARRYSNEEIVIHLLQQGADADEKNDEQQILP